ncbi:serine/threonine-protein kinase PITSLRE isoform X2 [Contarinia nasturtii]|uniref:serine/threonine-protein kinase PITSLRE isoform X2 n=1 Tax=Contarinia nasturtii TaxID=265458 RepID=UPI0012D49AAF|nr:serine/threonine-protein kinase PITSLRE isoform X2 [Contarinia nasturtii]
MANSTMAAYDSNDEDTDSLEIKPPQMINRYDKHKKSSRDSSSRDKKHSRGEHRHKDRTRERSDRHSRQHHSTQSSGRHHPNFDSSYDKYHLSSRDSSHQKRRKRYSPEKTDGERELEDLRSRLLSKRSKQDIERKIEEHQMYQRNGEEERNRPRDEQHQHKSHSKRSVIEVIDSPEDYGDLDPSEKYKSVKYNKTTEKPPEDPETIKRRAKFIDADREMTKRKELAREELEARRVSRREKGNIDESPPSYSHKHHKSHRRHRSPGEHSVIQLSESDDDDEDDDDDDKSSHSEKDDDDDDDTDSDSGTNTKSNYSRSDDQSDVDVPASPLSVGDLSKSEHRRRHSRSQSKSRSKSHSKSRSTSRSRSRSRSISRSTRSHSRSTSRESRSDRRRDSSRDSEHDNDKHSPYSRKRNRKNSNVSESEDVEMKSVETAAETKPSTETKAETLPEKQAIEEEELPDYYPGLQGCRSVEEFKCLNRIAEGTYGIVFRAQDKRTNEIVALKRLKMEKEKDGFPITSLREINTLLKGQHPNIVTVREIVVGSNIDKIFIVMDYVEHDFKTLMETMLSRKQKFMPAEVKCLTKQLLQAVAHLHDNWILHRDLKTSNLLLSHKGVLKVGDFGLAREYGSPLKAYTSVVVTLWYRAPELLLGVKEYSTPIDMWSVGCIFAEFLSMTPLFTGQTEIDQLNKIFKVLGTPNEKVWPGYNQLRAVPKFAEYPVSNLREKFGRHTTDLGIQMLQGLLSYDPKQRFTADQALRNNYFKELPLPIDPAMLPTWPAKSELGPRKALAASPKPPSGGSQFKNLPSDNYENRGFILGAALDAKARHAMAMGPGFNLKF